MGLDLEQFTDLIIEPTLEHLGLYSVAASELVLGTAIQESNLKYIKQLGTGPALGLFQMEPATHNDIWDNFLRYRQSLYNKVLDFDDMDATAMIWNMRYACAMCRVHYRRVREPLPAAGDIENQAHYWKDHYNTHLGAGTPDEYIENWEHAHED